MSPLTTYDMLRLALLEPGRCPVCAWPYRASMCDPGRCSRRSDDPAERATLAANRQTYARIEPLLRAAYRCSVVDVHVAHLRLGTHPDLTSALVGMVASLEEYNRVLHEAAVKRAQAEPPALDLSAYGGSIEAAAAAGRQILAARRADLPQPGFFMTLPVGCKLAQADTPTVVEAPPDAAQA